MTKERVRRRLAAVLALDVVGYSRLMAANEADTYNALIDCQKLILEPSVKTHAGRVVKLMGDGALVEFQSVVDAVECAIAMQEGFSRRNADFPEDRAIQIRIGINLGDIIRDKGDIFGDGVNVAARLEAMADPGGICISSSVYDQVKSKIDIGFEDLGLQTAKNLDEPVRVYRIISDTLDAPPEKLPPAPEKPSIAVLPLDNLSGDGEGSFCDAVTEDLTTALSRFDWLFVAARNAAFAYKGGAVDVKRVGRELGVRYVLEGSARRIGSRVRVNAQLVDAETLGHAWADRIDCENEDPFELQDDVVTRIASTLAPEIIQAEIVRSSHKPREKFAPWDHYLQAVDHYRAMTENDIEQAILHLEEAVKIDPQFAAAYALRSLCESRAAGLGWHRPVKEAYAVAERFAELAVRLSPSSPETNEAHAFLLVCTGRAKEGVIVARRSAELNPYFAKAHAVLAHALVLSGDAEAALQACEWALRSSPRDQRGSWIHDAHGHILFFLERYEEAIEVSERAIQHDPSLYGALVTIACANAELGRMDAARKAIDRLLALVPGFTLRAVSKNPMFTDSGYVERLLDSLRRAGLPE